MDETDGARAWMERLGAAGLVYDDEEDEWEDNTDDEDEFEEGEGEGVCVCVCVCVYGAWTGMARAIYVRCTFGIFGREITEYTVYTYGSGQPFRVWCMMYLYFISTCNIMLSYQIRHAWYNAIMQYYIRGTFWMKVLVHAASGQGVSDECMLQVARS